MKYRRAKIAGASYFFTLVTHERRPVFVTTETVALLLASIARVNSRYPFDIDAMVILPDHIHTVWTLPEGDADFPMRWRSIKEGFTKPFVRTQGAQQRSASRLAKNEQAIWQRRYWEHVIRNDDDFATHVDYIHYNPVRHGLVKAARDWPHSSFATWVERGFYEPHWGSDEKPPLPDWAYRCE